MLSRKADPISDERCPVLLVSGHGWRPGPALARQLNREYRVEIADQSALPRLLQQLARIDGPCHLIGHAHGSVPALQAALARPQQLLSLTLVNPAAFSLLRQLHDWESWEAASRFASHVIALHAAGATALAARVFVQFWFGRVIWWLLGPKQKSQLLRRLPGIVDELADLYRNALHPHDLLSLPMPVHLVCNRQTPQPSRRLAEQMQTLIPVATLSLIDRGNQGVDSNGATRIRDGIVTWLARQDSGSKPALAVNAEHSAWSDVT